jgi:hypothetical protein
LKLVKHLRRNVEMTSLAHAIFNGNHDE